MNVPLNKNLDLIYASAKNPLINMQDNELREILKHAIAANDIKTMVNATNLYTQSFFDTTYRPIWLESDFESNEWQITFSKFVSNNQSSSRVIKWGSLQLDDGTFLDEPQHLKLLNTFKFWLINIDNPIINGGKILSLGTVRNSMYRVFRLIESIISNGSAVNLSQMHLAVLNKDFILEILVSTLTVDDYNVPSYMKFAENARNELLKASSSYSSSKNSRCLVNIFDFNEDEYNRVNNFILDNLIVNKVFDSQSFKVLVFKNKLFSMFQSSDFVADMIHENYRNQSKFYGLYRKEEHTANTSFLANTDEVSMDVLVDFIKLLKQLSFSANQAGINIDNSVFSSINHSSAVRYIDVADRGRFKTLPVEPILNLMRKTFEFSYENIDEILESVFDIFKFQIASKNSTKRLNLCSRSNFTDLVNRLYPEKLACGDYLSSFVDVDLRKISLHSNTIINRYNVLISSVKFLFAIFSAKRISEIDGLKPFSNLIPDINPDETDYKTLFSIKSLVMKTGVNGPNAAKAVVIRPMIRSVARLIWKIECFNKKLMQLGVELPALFNLLSGSEIRLKFFKTSTVSYTTYVCDYFESPFINEKGQLKKLNFSTHQLRRFFAMMFFWSNGFDGLDSIRWMLGHSSSEHLYHYITESTNGAVLNGIKSAHLVNEVQNGKLETIDVLRKAISQYYDVAQANIEIERLSDAVRDYIDDEDYETNPSYISDTDINAIEDTIYKLLHDDVIRLEPTFFAVERGGVTVQDYRMILEVRELS